ncbi:MAG: hypothetical protein SNJ64_04000 [Endomicrobiia bacterium]
MTDVKDIIQEISLLEKKIEADIEQLKKQNKHEELKFISELEKNFLTELKNYESMLIEKNKQQIAEFEKSVIETYRTKLSEFDKKINNIEQNTEEVVNKIKEKILFYGNR